MMGSATYVLISYIDNLNIKFFKVSHDINVCLTINRLLESKKYDRLETRPVPHESMMNNMGQWDTDAQMTKMYFSDIFGLHLYFLGHSSQTPWNFLSDKSKNDLLFC